MGNSGNRAKEEPDEAAANEAAAKIQAAYRLKVTKKREQEQNETAVADLAAQSAAAAKIQAAYRAKVARARADGMQQGAEPAGQPEAADEAAAAKIQAAYRAKVARGRTSKLMPECEPAAVHDQEGQPLELPPLELPLVLAEPEAANQAVAADQAAAKIQAAYRGKVARAHVGGMLQGAEPEEQPEAADEAAAAKIQAAYRGRVAWTVARARKKFDQLDTNGNGLLDGDELLGLSDWVWSSFHPGDEPLDDDAKAAMAGKLLSRLDTNSDGHMDFDEFVDWFRKTCASIEKFRRGLAPQKKKQSGQARQRWQSAIRRVRLISSVAQRLNSISEARKQEQAEAEKYDSLTMAQLVHQCREAGLLTSQVFVALSRTELIQLLMAHQRGEPTPELKPELDACSQVLHRTLTGPPMDTNQMLLQLSCVLDTTTLDRNPHGAAMLEDPYTRLKRQNAARNMVRQNAGAAPLGVSKLQRAATAPAAVIATSSDCFVWQLSPGQLDTELASMLSEVPMLVSTDGIEGVDANQLMTAFEENEELFTEEVLDMWRGWQDARIFNGVGNVKSRLKTVVEYGVHTATLELG